VLAKLLVSHKALVADGAVEADELVVLADMTLHMVALSPLAKVAAFPLVTQGDGGVCVCEAVVATKEREDEMR